VRRTYFGQGRIDCNCPSNAMLLLIFTFYNEYLFLRRSHKLLKVRSILWCRTAQQSRAFVLVSMDSSVAPPSEASQPGWADSGTYAVISGKSLCAGPVAASFPEAVAGARFAPAKSSIGGRCVR
jgi:hypothetical protein